MTAWHLDSCCAREFSVGSQPTASLQGCVWEPLAFLGPEKTQVPTWDPARQWLPSALRIQSLRPLVGSPKPLCPGLPWSLRRCAEPAPSSGLLCLLFPLPALVFHAAQFPHGSSDVTLVFVPSGCANKISQTRWLLSNMNLFLIVLEAEVQGQGVDTARLREGPFPGC